MSPVFCHFVDKTTIKTAFTHDPAKPDVILIALAVFQEH